MLVPKTDWTTRFWLASVLACSLPLAAAQDHPWRGGANFDCRRTVELLSGGTPASVVVVEFLTHSRSTEAFLRDGQLDSARDELRRWETDFPGDKIEGYLPLLQARLWLAAGKHAQAIAVANNLITVNAASPYADQLVYLAAECEQKLGHTEQARARYESLVAHYPGSPLVESSREKLASLTDGESLQTKKTKKK